MLALTSESPSAHRWHRWRIAFSHAALFIRGPPTSSHRSDIELCIVEQGQADLVAHVGNVGLVEAVVGEALTIVAVSIKRPSRPTITSQPSYVFIRLQAGETQVDIARSYAVHRLNSSLPGFQNIPVRGLGRAKPDP